MKHDRLEFVAPAEGLTVGEELFLSVRPEKVGVGSAADGCANRFEGTIADEVCVGLSSKVTIQLDLGGLLISRVPIVDIGQSIPIGSHVIVGWDPGNAIIIKPPSETDGSRSGKSPSVPMPNTSCTRRFDGPTWRLEVKREEMPD